jgi:hypothetical protein
MLRRFRKQERYVTAYRCLHRSKLSRVPSTSLRLRLICHPANVAVGCNRRAYECAPGRPRNLDLRLPLSHGGCTAIMAVKTPLIFLSLRGKLFLLFRVVPEGVAT